MTAIAFAGTKFVADTGLVNRDIVVGETDKIVIETIKSYYDPSTPREGFKFLGVLVFAVAGDVNMQAIASKYILRQLQLQLDLPIFDHEDLWKDMGANPFMDNSSGVAVYVSPEGQIRSFYVTAEGMTENTMRECTATSYGATYFMLGVALGEDLETLMARVVGRMTGIGPNYQVVDVIEVMEEAKAKSQNVKELTVLDRLPTWDVDVRINYQEETDMRDKEPPITPPPMRVVKDPEISLFQPFRSLWKILTGRWKDL